MEDLTIKSLGMGCFLSDRLDDEVEPLRYSGARMQVYACLGIFSRYQARLIDQVTFSPISFFSLKLWINADSVVCQPSDPRRHDELKQS